MMLRIDSWGGRVVVQDTGHADAAVALHARSQHDTCRADETGGSRHNAGFSELHRHALSGTSYAVRATLSIAI
jgi:hypothetical protein